MPIPEVVFEKNRSSAANRFLAVLSKAPVYFSKPGKFSPPDYLAVLKRRIFEMLVAMGEKSTGPVIEDWYGTEPDAKARSIIVDPSLSWSRIPEWRARRKAILELAAKDCDKKIAVKAKALLAATNK